MQSDSKPAPAGAEGLCSRLHGVKKLSNDRWIARCPAHEDKRPSLAIRTLPDGRVLVRCFAGCETSDVISAIGLEWIDLFPPRPIEGDSAKPVRPAFDAWTALRCCTDDVLLAAIVISDVCRGKPLAAERRQQLWAISGRLRAAAELSGAVR
jgi:hypothetical protein